MSAAFSDRRSFGQSSRRDFLALGALGGLVFGLPAVSLGTNDDRQRAAAFARAKRCLLLFLTGGPPQHDTWDMKPDAPAQIRGELRPISTSVPGIQISELFPKLSGKIDKLRIVRSVSHADTVHKNAGSHMLNAAYQPIDTSVRATVIG